MDMELFKQMSKLFYFIKNNLFFIAILLVIMMNSKSFINNFKSEGHKWPHNKKLLSSVQGKPFRFQNRPQLVVFWATWCGPCKIELKRIQFMIHQKWIQAEDVLAISIDENLADVVNVIDKNKYTFPIVFGKHYPEIIDQVISTPTLLILKGNGDILWQTSGASLFLEARLLYYM